jgi:hypothetical protein
MGVLRLPFVFRPDAWTFEADVSEVSHSDAKNPPDMGILIWDGSANILRLGFREGSTANTKETKILAAGCLGKQTNYAKDLGKLGCGANETIRLVMACRQGMVSFGAFAQGKSAAIAITQPLPFVPKWVGLYLRTRSKDDSASAVFDNVRVVATPDPEAIKQLATTRRDGLVAKARADQEARADLAKEIAESAGGAPADWDKHWAYDGRSDKESHQKMDAKGRTGVWRTCAHSPDRPARWHRRIRLDPGKSYFLHLEVAAEGAPGWQLIVEANNKEILTRQVGASWQSCDVDLSAFAGQEIVLELNQKIATPANKDYGYWDKVYLGCKP